jgi:hypothetical protein
VDKADDVKGDPTFEQFLTFTVFFGQRNVAQSVLVARHVEVDYCDSAKAIYPPWEQVKPMTVPLECARELLQLGIAIC